MRNESLAGIGSISYAIGDRRPIEELKVFSDKESTLSSLKKKGVEYFSESTCTPAELALHAAKNTLEISGVNGADIEAIIYATTSFWEKQFYSERDIAWLMNELGLINAYPIGVFLPGCTNVVSAMHIAVNMIRAEGCENIIVVTTDRVVPDNDSKRVMWPDVTILSDAAASFMVTRKSRSDFDIVAISHKSSPFMWDLDYQNNFAAFLISTVKGAQKTVKDVMESACLPPSSVRTLLTNNYNIPVMKMLARKCGFDEGKIYLGNVSRIGHAYSADLLINIKDALDDHPAQRGDQFLMLGTGHKNWGGVVLRKN